MNDTQIGGLLRSLPRTKASSAFTDDVLRRVRRGEEKRPAFVWRMAAAFAMAACLVGVVHLALVRHSHRERVAQLRAEQQKLERELEAVKKIASEAEPLLVLENSSGTRVIMDLDSAIQPASLKTYD